jgi:hypothetical protein
MIFQNFSVTVDIFYTLPQSTVDFNYITDEILDKRKETYYNVDSFYGNVDRTQKQALNGANENDETAEQQGMEKALTPTMFCTKAPGKCRGNCHRSTAAGTFTWGCVVRD